MAIPRYEVLSRTYIEPMLIDKGSIIEYVGTPGPHLYPLNDEAVAMFEAWYSEEHPALDNDGEPIFYLDEHGQRTQKMCKPHAKFRRQDYRPAEKERFNLIEGPPKPKPEELNHTLAGLGLKTATADYRPPPDRIYRDAPVMAPEGGVVEVPTPEPVVSMRVVGKVPEGSGRRAPLGKAALALSLREDAALASEIGGMAAEASDARTANLEDAT